MHLSAPYVRIIKMLISLKNLFKSPYNRQNIILAFEPDERNFSILKDNIEMNKLLPIITLNKVALSDTDGHSFFTTLLDGENHLLNEKSKNSLKVITKSLDNYCKEKSISKIAY